MRGDTTHPTLAVCAALSCLCVASPAAAQAPVPLGPSFQVNSYSTFIQFHPSLAAAADGDFVVVWQSYYADADPLESIQGQRFGSDGSAQGTQFQVNAYATGDQDFPSVAAAPDGDFVVAWQSSRGSGTDTHMGSVEGRRFASDGSALGAQFQVNTYTTYLQRDPAVAVAAAGDFVVVWTSDGSVGTDTSSNSIQGQRYASSGSAQGAQFQVNTFTTGDQRNASVATDTSGDFVVVWVTAQGSSAGTDTHESSIQGQRYAADGSASGAQFQVNTNATGPQDHPSVAATPDGGFIVVWMDDKLSPSDPNPYGIHGRRYTADGSALGAQFQLNTFTTGRLDDPVVAVADDGGFVVAWVSEKFSYPANVRGQRFASNGSAQGTEFEVSASFAEYEARPSIAASGGRLVATWQGLEEASGDYEVWARRFTLPGATAVPALSSPAALALGAALLLAAYALKRRA